MRKGLIKSLLKVDFVEFPFTLLDTENIGLNLQEFNISSF